MKSPVTKAAYSYALSKFMNYLKIKNPDDLLQFKENPKFIQQNIINYLITLKNPPHSLRYATRSQYLAAIMTFYELNDVVLNKKIINRYLGEEERPIENRGYTTKEIAKMLEFGDERIRAIILFLASTGVRIRAITELKVVDLTSIPEYDLYRVRVYAEAKQRYFTFTTPEATKALDSYLKYRELSGEKLLPSSPLFRNQFNRNDPDSVHNAHPIELRNLEGLVSQMLQKSGITFVERQTKVQGNRGRIRKDVQLTSGFRKFFDTQLIYGGVEPHFKEKFMGHSIGLDDHYFKPGENNALQEYVKAIDILTINEENRLKKQVKELSKKQSEIDAMREKHEQEMKLMHEKMNQIMSMIQQNPVLAHVKPDVLARRGVK